MRLTGIDIHGFGIFNGFSCTKLSEKLTVFLGENEAGKTTLMSFIRQMLFGFPTGHQKNVQRYPPFMGGRYGGNLTFVLEDGESITVRRHRPDRATRDDVTVEIAGEVQGEAYLKRILHPTTLGI